MNRQLYGWVAFLSKRRGIGRSCRQNSRSSVSFHSIFKRVDIYRLHSGHCWETFFGWLSVQPVRATIRPAKKNGDLKKASQSFAKFPCSFRNSVSSRVFIPAIDFLWLPSWVLNPLAARQTKNAAQHCPGCYLYQLSWKLDGNSRRNENFICVISYSSSFFY